MHITHISEQNMLDPDSMSGTPYWISKGLEFEDVEIHNLYVGIPHKLLPPVEEFVFRCKQFWLKFYKRAYLVPDLFTRRALHVANTLKDSLASIKTDAILTSHTPIAAAFLETEKPIVYWTDAVYAGLVGFYPRFRFHHPDTMWDGHEITNTCLMRAKLLIFSSEWAARTAIEFYGVSEKKVKIVPYGANLHVTHTLADVKTIVSGRSKNLIKLLFVGKEWYRKGGDIALEIAEELQHAGYPIELTIAGCQLNTKLLPSYVKHAGFISKKNPTELMNLYKESHFLILPSRADACPIVFAEANAFGVPCITSYVGGISTAIKNNINGMTFSLESSPKEYCDYIIKLINNYSHYEQLAYSSFNEYQTRLNWKTAASHVKNLIKEIL